MMQRLKSPLFAISILGGALVLSGCGSKEKKVTLDEPEKLDRAYVNKTGERNETIGEKNGGIVIQKKMSLEEDMTRVRDQINDAENSIYGSSRQDPGGMWLKLKECRKKIADARLGGNGVPDAMEKWEKISTTDPDLKYRVEDKKKVVAVSEEQLEDRLSHMKNVKNILDRRYEEYKDKLDACEDRYASNLVRHGLDPEDAKAQGEWVDGPNGYRVWKMKTAPTANPEELMRRKEARESQRKSNQ